MEATLQQDGKTGARYVSYAEAKPVEGEGDLAPQAHANTYLERSVGDLGLTAMTLKSLGKPLADLPEDELAGLRVEVEKDVADSIVVGYAQTYFGLAVIGAGVSVTLRKSPRPCRARRPPRTSS